MRTRPANRMDDTTDMIDPASALIYTMVLVSAADSDMTDPELHTIGDTVKHLPIFSDFDENMLAETAQACAEQLAADNGLDQVIDQIADALPAKLCETAYALACDVAASDGAVSQEELRFLEFLRHRLNVGRLEAAAIERGTRARFMTA